jgi:hypothetical protein
VSKYQTRQEFAEHCDWEGGLLETVFGYGVDPASLPDGELADAIRELLKVEPLIRRIEKMLDSEETAE